MRIFITSLLCCGFMAAAGAQTPVPKENLISYWTGEPVGGGSGMRADEIGSNHLWGPSESLVVAGINGNATVLDGSGALRCNLKTDTYASGLQTVGREITYAGWIQVDSLQDDQVIAGRWSRWAPARQFKLSYIASSGVLQLAWSDSGNESTQTIADDLAIEDDTWYFVAFGRSDAADRMWLSVTSGAGTAPRSAVTHSPAPTNPVAEDGEVWFWYDQIAKTNSYGMFDEWAAYNTTLSTDELAWLFNGGAGRTYDDFTYVVEPTLGFFHDMEQEEPAGGRISYYSYSEPNAFLSNEQAAGGSQSLKITGSWGQIQLFNDSNTHYWCEMDRCRVSMDIYVVTFAESFMLFQMDGKVTSGLTEFDTNEGMGVMFHTRNDERGFSMSGARTSGYYLPLEQWVHVDYLRDRTRTAPDNAYELYVDGELVLAVEGEEAPYTPDPYVARAWHHISLGNDVVDEPVFYIDNFEVAPEPWADELAVRPMSSLTATVGETLTLSPAVTGAGATAVYAWTRVSGPDSVVFGNAAAGTTTVRFDAPGTYELQLAVIAGTDTVTGTLAAVVTASVGMFVPGTDRPAPRVVMSSNPMRSAVRFTAGADITGMVVYDRTGRVVHTVYPRTAAGSRPAGEQRAIMWDGYNVSGRPAPAGTYFYRIETAEGTRTGSFVKIAE